MEEVKKMIDCHKCKNYLSDYCTDCVHSKFTKDFYEETEYETYSSKTNNQERRDDDEE